MFIDIPPGFFGSNYTNGKQKRKSSQKKRKKKKCDNWFETCTVSQLKDLCKAAKQQVSGAKDVLVQRLIGLEATRKLGLNGQAQVSDLKRQLKEKCLVMSGNKFDLVLRLLHDEFGTTRTDQVKRAFSTEMVVTMDPATGQETQVLQKKRKTTPKPKAIYSRVAKKINAVTQKKYQTHYGSKDHSPAVYSLMTDLIVDHCIQEKVIDSDPLLAEEMARAVFQAFHDHWQVMERTGYETQDFRAAVDAYADVLRVARPKMSSGQVETVVSLLESVEACVSGHYLSRRANEDMVVYYSTGKGRTDNWPELEKYRKAPKYKDDNVFEQTIRVVMPDYNKENREKKVGKPLDREVRMFSMSVLTRPI